MLKTYGKWKSIVQHKAKWPEPFSSSSSGCKLISMSWVYIRSVKFITIKVVRIINGVRYWRIYRNFVANWLNKVCMAFHFRPLCLYEWLLQMRSVFMHATRETQILNSNSFIRFSSSCLAQQAPFGVSLLYLLTFIFAFLPIAFNTTVQCRWITLSTTIETILIQNKNVYKMWIWKLECNTHT